jgi:hypothetical protein
VLTTCCGGVGFDRTGWSGYSRRTFAPGIPPSIKLVRDSIDRMEAIVTAREELRRTAYAVSAPIFAVRENGYQP